jgi:flagellar hook assembly protein FlgD
VRLAIHDATGRLVKVLLDGAIEPGWRRATWDGRNAQGQPAAAGVYFTKLEVGEKAIHRKIVLLK